MRRVFLTRLLSVLLGFALMMGLVQPVRAAESITYDFDSGLQGWTILDADGDGHNWTAVSDFGNVYSYYISLDPSEWVHNEQGDSLVSGSYINGVGPLAPDNYLISPKVTLGGSISFYAYNVDYYYEQIGVFVSVSGTEPSDFTKVASWYMDRDREWVEYTVDLSAYEGEGYVAIRNYGSYDEYLVVIDDVTITTPDKSHEHNFVFTADGDIITAVCTAEGCDLEGGVTLQITMPEKKVYDDGLSPLATLSGLDSFNEITGLMLNTDDIRYFDLTSGAELNEAPVDAGQYEARISTGESEGAVTAVVAYEISKAKAEFAPPAGKELTYNGENQELITAGESEDGTFEYALAAADETPAEEDFSKDLSVGKDAGTYYVYYRFVPDSNHENAELAEPIKVTIAPAVLTVTADAQEKNKGASDPELTYTAIGLFNDDEVTGKLTRTEGEEPGEYAITIGTLDAGSNYVIDFTEAKLVIKEPAAESVDITVKKIWNDDNNKDGIRPDSITVNLLADGEKVRYAKVTADKDWTFTFENLPKYMDGKEIKYTVTEEKVEGYKCSIDGFTITNTSTRNSIPETSDTNNIWPYTVLMSGSIILLILAAFIRKKSIESE